MRLPTRMCFCNLLGKTAVPRFSLIRCMFVFAHDLERSLHSPCALLFFQAMALVTGTQPAAILLDSGDEMPADTPTPLPEWARRMDLKPPTMSMDRPIDVFERIAEQGVLFETYANCGGAFVPAACFCCSICTEFLEEPASCHSCEQVVCSRCWKKHRDANGTSGDFVCPLCRSFQPTLNIARYMEQVLQHELHRNGICFQCNSSPPGSRPDALWCCQKQFSTLKELRGHLESMSPFRTTRTHLRRLLSLAVAGNKGSRDLLFDDPVQRSKLSTVLEEDTIASRVAQRRLLAQRSCRSRSRSPTARSLATGEVPEDQHPSQAPRRRIVLRHNRAAAP